MFKSVVKKGLIVLILISRHVIYIDQTLYLDTLLVVLCPISDDFKLLGSVARICSNTLDEIVASSTTSYDGLVEVCAAWLDKCHREKITPTWRAVSKILSLMGHETLSCDIMQVYKTGNLPIEIHDSLLNVREKVPSIATYQNLTNLKGEMIWPASESPVSPNTSYHHYQNSSKADAIALRYAKPGEINKVNKINADDNSSPLFTPVCINTAEIEGKKNKKMYHQ